MEPRVLSIQSHVVHGYVGNRCAAFPLQLLGFEVDAVNSAQLCCHTGYEHWQGQILEAADLEILFNGLKLNDIERHYTHIITAYCRSDSWLLKVADVVRQVRQKNPNLTFVCDPVLGDHGAYYVPEALMPIYRDVIIPLADIITPNQFEASQLTGIEIFSEGDAVRAMNALHAKGCKIVVISSTDFGDESTLIAFGSSMVINAAGQPTFERIRMRLPRIPLDFLGTGDLFTCLLMAWLHKTDNNLQLACEKSQSTMQAVLKRTWAYAVSHSELHHVAPAVDADEEKDADLQHTKLEPVDAAIRTKKHPPSMYERELRLIQSKSDIESPPNIVQAEKW